jgi:hypothetical protein
MITSPDIRELAQRRSQNLEITLLWNRRTQRVSIAIHDYAADERTVFRVPNDRALDAFHHPFVYEPTAADRRAANLRR